MSRPFKRRELLKKAGAVSAASIVGTVVAEAAPQIAGGTVALVMHFVSGNGKLNGASPSPNCTVPMPSLTGTAKAVAIIQSIHPPTCEDAFPEYPGMRVMAWYRLPRPRLYEVEGFPGVHGPVEISASDTLYVVLFH